jgi:hypothetical protein
MLVLVAYIFQTRRLDRLVFCIAEPTPSGAETSV